MFKNKEDFLTAVTAIGTCEDDVQRRELLASLQNETAELFDSHDTLTKSNANLTADNEKLRNANMSLFLQIGANKTPEQQQRDSTGIESHENKAPRKFEDLFDEKGGIK